jgi:long-subunit acyl-CoA synthetase (AMP-forming)
MSSIWERSVRFQHKTQYTHIKERRGQGDKKKKRKKKKENKRKKWDTYRLFDERNESVAFGLERLGIPHNAAVSAEMEK